ncbi:hypothetical protein DPMN_084588 [Dreissena polymorpha]|uniref:Uncharacterized protein n=1 Tax=Dreissena polymorpha TaxID=45954 RepID=A0A9D4BC52_DREPO|nr:hypothetical protein DPMN_084588 [Dreissena polymorpha]
MWVQGSKQLNAIVAKNGKPASTKCHLFANSVAERSKHGRGSPNTKPPTHEQENRRLKLNAELTGLEPLTPGVLKSKVFRLDHSAIHAHWRWEWLHEKDYAVVYGRGVNWLRKSCGKKAFRLHAEDPNHIKNIRTIKTNQV